jgi:hypothetical protein
MLRVIRAIEPAGMRVRDGVARVTGYSGRSRKGLPKPYFRAHAIDARGGCYGQQQE